MRITPIEKEDKTGRIITLRNAEISDADNLITYMKITSFETPFLLREPDEFHLTSEQEECFIQNTIDNPRELMLLATADGCHIGNCSLLVHLKGINIAVRSQSHCIKNIGAAGSDR